MEIVLNKSFINGSWTRAVYQLTPIPTFVITTQHPTQVPFINHLHSFLSTPHIPPTGELIYSLDLQYTRSKYYWLSPRLSSLLSQQWQPRAILRFPYKPSSITRPISHHPTTPAPQDIQQLLYTHPVITPTTSSIKVPMRQSRAQTVPARRKSSGKKWLMAGGVGDVWQV